MQLNWVHAFAAELSSGFNVYLPFSVRQFVTREKAISNIFQNMIFWFLVLTSFKKQNLIK